MAIRIEESPTRGILPELEPVKSRTKLRMWDKLQKFLGRDDNQSPAPSPGSGLPENKWNHDQQPATRRDFGRRVGIGLPRPATFRRQNSERRDRLEPHQPCVSERRTVSAHRQQRAVSVYSPRSASSPSTQIPPQVSAPSLSLSSGTPDPLRVRGRAASQTSAAGPTSITDGTANKVTNPYRSLSRSSSERFDEVARDEKHQIDLELDTKWILNLSMHFRDKSDREKFFVTFAKEPNRWRRVTVSCDYRNAERDSLESDLRELHYQRDKNAQIYESIRDSLPSIQFYNTVTNLKLETEDGRLHVHVTEDVNETIPYPPRLSVQHILTDGMNPIAEAGESQINFLSHLSGFVYKVSFLGQEYIKKEIPGPDSVDEFLYEVNALHALSASSSVIRLEAIVFDDSRQTVKGLLISYAVRGALVDLLYDHKGSIPWGDRMRWARQAIQGLSEIHEEGYVQGDFTLSNIVVNSDNHAKIIDINRRGCPVGWEPPEIANKIASSQRISMYISQKSDLYQLGMTLWALAMDEDEPERHDQPLSMAGVSDEVPDWYKEIVNICLSRQPRDRLSAKELLRQFPLLPADRAPHEISKINDTLDERSLKRYIDPCAAVEREDLERLGRRRRRSTSVERSDGDASFIDPPLSSYQFDSGSSVVGVRIGRRPPLQSENEDEGDFRRRRSEDHGTDVREGGNDLPPRIISISPGREPRYEGFDFDNDPDQEPQSSSALNHSNPPRRQLAEDPPQSDEVTTAISSIVTVSAIPQSRLDAEFQTLDGDLELPNPHDSPPDVATTSIISDGTPRNANSVVITPTTSIPAHELDPTKADLAGFGGHPCLEEHCPHEPMKIPDTQYSQYYDTHPQPQPFSESTDTTVQADESHESNLVELPSDTTSADLPCTTKPSESIQSSVPSSTTALEEKQPSGVTL